MITASLWSQSWLSVHSDLLKVQELGFWRLEENAWLLISWPWEHQLERRLFLCKVDQRFWTVSLGHLKIIFDEGKGDRYGDLSFQRFDSLGVNCKGLGDYIASSMPTIEIRNLSFDTASQKVKVFSKHCPFIDSIMCFDSPGQCPVFVNDKSLSYHTELIEMSKNVDICFNISPLLY